MSNNNLQPPDYIPRLSDVRASVPSGSSTPTASALSRRNAVARNIRRDGTHRLAVERASIRSRRLQGSRSNHNLPSPPVSRSSEEPASKRRRMGRSGQLEIEQLPMELRYCDGGRYDGPAYTRDYSPECALRDDSSVYCTKNARCNMILRHVDGECFSLTKLVIRAPRTGYTSPVRAGMLFVTMEETDLLSRTNYTVRYESDEGCDDSTDEESYDLRFLESDPGDPANETDIEPYGTSYLPPPRNPGNPNTLPRGGAPSSSALWANVDEQINQSRPPPAELLQPNATFSHKDKKSTCVIDFETAISGRYILAKFFSTPEQKNIDIEFIGAYGWVGRRFFPAITMR
ncbi:hypothetical protein FN846DRAFT_111428 [Sphaerosporella brunnea]|uniref:Uncharacterized protein n=1 Tax=Sphaerosporella brunnea TaxID=1250544 RepID=A0A5J5ET11_9PEZI|nr:hypothetical protein FN846DRAFT_111428 [Sphaerosporella brunnea]